MRYSVLLIYFLFILISSCKKENVPEADFNIINNNCIAPCEVQFSNQSKNAFTYRWDFGDGTSSVEENPSHLYQDWGTYNVALTATNTDGESSISKVVTIIDTTGSSGTRIIELEGDLNFGDVILNPNPEPNKSFSIKNIGNLTLNITAATPPDGFNTDFNTSISIDPQNEHFVQVTFGPTEEKDYSGNIIITSNTDSGGNTIPVNGVGVSSGGGNFCEFGEFTDPRDGEKYCTVEIGGQIWMAENLRYDVVSPAPGSNDDFPYMFDDTNLPVYGRLYEWIAIMNGENPSNQIPSGVQGICPDGWHIPSLGEWELLINFYGGGDPAYEHLIVGGDSGFNAQLGGTMGRDFMGGLNTTNTFGEHGYYWTCSPVEFFPDRSETIIFDETSLIANITDSSEKQDETYSCRCVKD